ncbi:TonB-dependent receptor [Thalassotalea marina]|uniref:Oar protein n=1 Tax=Thalassotalea marina TaxID=1673741 RepID=A0A919B9S1_9GAMM|nr:TonB-dependent receptor plug domain-containing protein [Thalassotalea marina]GHF77288.1 Oar protein [Thalassotalea marina]
MLKNTLVTLAISAALGLTLPAIAADNTSGSIYGTTQAGSTVTIKNQDTGLTRTITVGSDGRFTFTRVPTGNYVVTDANGKKQNLVVRIGSGTLANFDDEIEVLEVTGGRFSKIDVTSTESTTVFTSEDLDLLPIGQDVTSVAMLAPGTVKGDSAFGNVASFGGSSPAENGYYINGFDITNLRTLLNFSAMPFEAIGQQQVKTGGYGAEFGKSLGGVVNIVTKSGTNEFKFGASVTYQPDSFTASAKDAISHDPADDVDHRFLNYLSADKTDILKYIVHGSGPIIEDKLFFFALIEGIQEERNEYFQNDSRLMKNNTPKFITKLDWYITDNHILEFTGIKNDRDWDRTNYVNPERPDESTIAYTGEHGDLDSKYTQNAGGYVAIAKYTGQFTDDFSLSAQWGKLRNEIFNEPGILPGAECPRVWDSRGDNPSALNYLGCWNRNQATIRDESFGPNFDQRVGFRVDAEWFIGDHTVRFGIDNETWESGVAGTLYTGDRKYNNYYFRYFTAGENTVLNGERVAPGTEYVRTWDGGATSGGYEVKNSAIYLEDSWQVTDNFMAYAGLRLESFENLNAEGATFIESDNNLAPRFGFSWDMDGDSTRRVYGSLGRYFIPVAANTNQRMSGVEWRDTAYWHYDGMEAGTSAPLNMGPEIGSHIKGTRNAPDSRTLAVKDLDAMHQDELILGYQQEFDELYTVGVKAVYRKVQDGMDDYCSAGSIQQWAEDNNYNNFDYHSVGCFMLNPGRDIQIALDLENNGTATEVTIPNEGYFDLPEYKRTYKALEFTFSRAYEDGWYIDGSYTMSFSEGNMEGYVNSTLGQDDAGLTQDFDHGRFMDGTFGYLPSDRRHSLKVWGGYDLTDEIRLTANLNVTSGRPLNCNGFVPLDGLNPIDQSNLSRYSGSSFYCLDENNETQLTQRGSQGRTPWTWTMDFGVNYRPDWANDKLDLQFRVTNLFNNDKPVEFLERSQAEQENRIQDVNFLKPTRYQAPRQATFIARYKF